VKIRRNWPVSGQFLFYLMFLILLLHIAGLWDLLWNNNKELNLEGVFLL